MKTSWSIAIETAILGVARMTAQNIKVGTFHKPSIVVAYYRSQMWADLLKPKMAELAEAKKANDIKKAEELEKWGQAHQETAHQQLTGEAPIANILEALQHAFPDIARKAQVEIIAADLQYAGRTVQTVDIPDLLLDSLKPYHRTRTTIHA